MSDDVTVKSAADRLAAMLLLHSSMVGRRKAGKWSSFHCGMKMQLRTGNNAAKDNGSNSRRSNESSNNYIRRRLNQQQSKIVWPKMKNASCSAVDSSEDDTTTDGAGRNVIMTSKQTTKTSLTLTGSSSVVTNQGSLDEGLTRLLSNYFCSLCNKQYNRQREFDNHLQSYDHAHGQRLKELKTREVRRQMWNRRRKRSRAKGDKEVRRLLEFANERAEVVILKAQNTGPKSSPSSWPPPPLSNKVSEEIPDSRQTDERRQNQSTKAKSEMLCRLDSTKVSPRLNHSSSFSPSSSSFIQTGPFVDGFYAQATREPESSGIAFPVAEAGSLLQESTTGARKEERKTTISSKRKQLKRTEICEIGIEVEYHDNGGKSSQKPGIKRLHPNHRDEEDEGPDRKQREKSGRGADDLEEVGADDDWSKLNRRRPRKKRRCLSKEPTQPVRKVEKKKTKKRPKRKRGSEMGSRNRLSQTSDNLQYKQEGNFQDYSHRETCLKYRSMYSHLGACNSDASEALQACHTWTRNNQLRQNSAAQKNPLESFASNVNEKRWCTRLQSQVNSSLVAKQNRNLDYFAVKSGKLSSDLSSSSSRQPKWQENHGNMPNSHQSAFFNIDDRENQLSSNPRQRKTSAICPMVRGEISSAKNRSGFGAKQPAAKQRKSNQQTTTDHVTGSKRLRRRLKKREEDLSVVEKAPSGTDCFQAIGPNDPLIFKRPSPLDRTLKISNLTGTTVEDLNPVLSAASQCAIYRTTNDDIRDGMMTWSSVGENWRDGASALAAGVFLCNNKQNLLQMSKCTGNRKTLTRGLLRGNQGDWVRKLPRLLTLVTNWQLILPYVNPQLSLSPPPPPSSSSSSSSPPPLVLKPSVVGAIDSWAFTQRSPQQKIVSCRPIILSHPCFPDCPSSASSFRRHQVFGRGLRPSAEEAKRTANQLKTLCTIGPPPVATGVHCPKPIATGAFSPFSHGHLRHSTRFNPPDTGLFGCRLPAAGAPSYEFINTTTTSSSSSRRSIHACNLCFPRCFGFYRRTEVRAFDRLVTQPYLMMVPLPVTFCMLIG